MSKRHFDMTQKTLIGARIKALRERRGLTQERLAELIDRSVDAVSQLERGVTAPSFETLQRLSAGLEVPVKEFFDGEDGSGTARRAALMATLLDVARSLSDDDLDIGVKQIEALARRSR